MLKVSSKMNLGDRTRKIGIKLVGETDNSLRTAMANPESIRINLAAKTFILQEATKPRGSISLVFLNVRRVISRLPLVTGKLDIIDGHDDFRNKVEIVPRHILHFIDTSHRVKVFKTAEYRSSTDGINKQGKLGKFVAINTERPVILQNPIVVPIIFAGS